MSDSFYDIYDFYYVPFWNNNIFISFIALLLITLSLFLLYKFIKRKKQVPVTYWQTALIALESIDPRACSSKKEFKKFYFELSYTLKKFLEKRFNIKLENKTESEIEIYFKECGYIENAELEHFVNILQGAVFIKFANKDALPVKALEDWSLAKNIVKKTIPMEINTK